MITWFGQNLCDEGFVINLKKRSDRKLSAQNSLSRSGIEGVCFFDAIEIPNSPYGCTQSHIELYKYQVENKIPYLLILEDDISDCYSYSVNHSIINKDKKILYTKYLIESFNNLQPDLLWLGTRTESNVGYCDNYISYTRKTLTSHAYISSYKLAKFSIEHLRYTDREHFSINWPIDFFLSQIKTQDCWQLQNNKYAQKFLNNNLTTTISNCLIYNQKKDYSDIIHKNCDYSVWILGSHEEYCFKQIKDKINYHEYI